MRARKANRADWRYRHYRNHGLYQRPTRVVAALGGKLDPLGWLLGTAIVTRTGLSDQHAKTRAVSLGDEDDTLGRTYQDMAVAGQCSPRQRALFLEAGDRMVSDLGAEAIVLAGTDLNLAFDGQQTDYRVIDALDVHVDLLARIAVGEASSPTT